MRVLAWLKEGDPVIETLTKRHLENEQTPNETHGYIQRYIDLYDPSTRLWGGGVYGPKWISTHYTLMELKYMAIDPNHPYYHEGLSHVIDYEWVADDPLKVDMCIIGMLVGLSAYGHSKDPRLLEMIDFIVENQQPDGGWNCRYLPKRGGSKKSSLHTTLSVLEGFAEVLKNGYPYKRDRIEKCLQDGEAFILKKRFFRRESTGEAIHPRFTQFHYPPRWYYDMPRALEYFVDMKRPYSNVMDESLDLIEKAIEKGYVSKGTQYSGKIHFPLEEGRGGRFNTLRALKILRAYRPLKYHEIICTEYQFSK